MTRKSTSQIEREKKRLKQWLKTLLKDDVDKFDLNAHYDSTLDFQENKTAIYDEIQMFIDPAVKMELEAKEAKYHEEVDLEIENKKIEEEAEKIKAEEKAKILTATANLDEYYANVETAIRKLVTGHINGVVLKGVAAIGKSFQVTKYLEKYNADYVTVNGDVTEAYLYRLLYENRNKIIRLQDTSKLLTNISAINKLKAALETEDVRVMTKSSYSKQQSDLPDSFIFSGKIIIEINSTFGLPRGLREDFDALLSRCEVVEIAFSFEDICKILLKVCKEPWEIEVTKHIIDNYEFTGENALNLRSQWHAFKTYKFAIENDLDWKEEINKSFIKKESHIRKLVYRFIGNNVVKSGELAKMLLRAKIYNSFTTANRRIMEWINAGEIFKISNQQRNYYISLHNPANKEQKFQATHININ